MSHEPERIFLIGDSGFGDKIIPLAKLGRIWMIKSLLNEAAARSLWDAREYPLDHVTVFDAIVGVANPDQCLDQIDSINEHFPEWTVIEVVGAQLTDEFRAALDGYGPGSYEKQPGGFAFSRQ